MKNLEGKVALVTGGSRGIGKEICKELAKQGAFIWVNYSSNESAANDTVSECESLGASAKAIGFNVANSDEVDGGIARIKEESGKVDILVNNAGIVLNGLSVRLSDDDWNKVIQVNLSGSFYCARATGKLMMKARAGKIINISSVVGEMGNPGQAAYVSSKAGVIGLTKSLAKEFAPRGITVNCVTPGFITTEMTDSLDDKTKNAYLSGIPLGAFGTGADIAKSVAFLASDSASYITGQILGVNGGLYM